MTVVPAAGRLLELARAYPLEGFERSFKVSTHRLLTERFLFGIQRARLRTQMVADFCRGLGIPPVFLSAAMRAIPSADTLHFGYEGQGKGAFCKLYLEFWRRLNDSQSSLSREESVPLYLAFKWDPDDPQRQALARYTCYPWADAATMKRRLTALYGGGSARCPSWAFVQELLDSLTQAGKAAPMYIEVREDGCPRRSFDLNLHDLDLPMTSLAVPTLRLGNAFGLAGGALEGLLGALGNLPVGHVSGGTGRDGDDFLTVYYRDSDPFGPQNLQARTAEPRASGGAG